MEEGTIGVTATLEDLKKALEALLRNYKTYRFYINFEEVEDK